VILEGENNKSRKDEVCRAIEKTVSGFKTVMFEWLEKPFIWYTQPGERLVSQSKYIDYEREKKGYGSTGAFGHTKTCRMVFTTAGHLFPEGEKEDAYVRVSNQPPVMTSAHGENLGKDSTNTDETTTSSTDEAQSDQRNDSSTRDRPSSAISVSSLKEDFVQVGTCLAHLGDGSENKADFAIIKIDPENEHLFKDAFMMPDSKSSLAISLYTEDEGELLEKIVYKIGPETTLTKGIVVKDAFYFTGDHIKKRRPYLWIEPIDEIFAKPGDSGAPVFRKVFKNGVPTAEIVSTVVMGSADPEAKDPIVITSRMDDALNELNEEKKIEVRLGTSSEAETGS